MVIIGDNEMVVLDLRKLIFSCFLVRMSDDGVGVEAHFHEKVREFLNSSSVLSYTILLVVDKMDSWSPRWLCGQNEAVLSF